MRKTRNIAVVIDIDWPVKHHYEVIAGIQKYARKRGNWHLTIDLFPERARGRAPLCFRRCARAAP